MTDFVPKSFIKNFYRHYHFAKWLLLGKPIPPNSYVKQYLIRKAFLNSNASIFIETGTLHGRTLEVIAPLAQQAYSIELDPDYYQKALSKFKNYANLSLIHGDSGIVIHDILRDINKPAFFWLDAHFSGGNTGKGEKDTPIFEELQAILKHPIKGHIIWIDDARCFDGTHDYPTIADLRQRIKLPLIIQNDIIQIG